MHVLVDRSAAVGSCSPETLSARTDNVNAACCEQGGTFECAAGAPWTCDAACALEFGPFWEQCMAGMSGVAEMASFAQLYATCGALPLGEDQLLIRTVNGVLNDP
eukprot:COSAG06_NODE_11126_length_1563_cov_1.550546_2_plen_105_part_00